MMAQVEDLTSKIKGFVIENFPAARKRNLTDDVSLLESGIVDSIGILEIVAFIEKSFQVTISDDDLTPENFNSIKAIAAFLQARVGAELPAEF